MKTRTSKRNPLLAKKKSNIEGGGLPYRILFWHKTKRGEIKMNLQRYFFEAFKTEASLEGTVGKGNSLTEYYSIRNAIWYVKEEGITAKLFFRIQKREGMSKFHEVIWSIKKREDFWPYKFLKEDWYWLFLQRDINWGQRGAGGVSSKICEKMREEFHTEFATTTKGEI